MKWILTLLCFSTSLFASSGSFSKNCQARISFCDKPAAHTGCKEEHAGIFASQVATVFDGEISSETHTITLSGFLEQKEEPKLLGAAGEYIVYQSKKYLLAIPYNTAGKVAVRQIGALDSPDGGGWQRLCQ